MSAETAPSVLITNATIVAPAAGTMMSDRAVRGEDDRIVEVEDAVRLVIDSNPLKDLNVLIDPRRTSGCSGHAGTIRGNDFA